MRIGMMVDSYKPYVSGVTNYVSSTNVPSKMQGTRFDVFTFGDVEYQDDEPRIIRSPALPRCGHGFYLSLRHKTKHKKLLQTMDVVHVHHPFLSGRLALNYCRSAKIPVVFTNHTRYDLYAQARLPLMPEEVSHGLLQAYLPDFCDAVDLVVSPSTGMAKVLRELGVKCHIEVVPNGVDLGQFHQASHSTLPFGFTDQDICWFMQAGSRLKRISISCYSLLQGLRS
jgi:glycosyltransferase involved in cell wall biosynthesis